MEHCVFVASLKLLYEETLEDDRLLKDVAIKTAGKHAIELYGRDDFNTLCREQGEIALDALKASLVSLLPLKPCNCAYGSMYVRWGGAQFHCRMCNRYSN